MNGRERFSIGHFSFFIREFKLEVQQNIVCCFAREGRDV